MVDLQANSDSTTQPYINDPGKIESHHQFISFNYKKFKKCDYCNEQLSELFGGGDGFLSCIYFNFYLGVIKNELKCEVCYMRIHKKCQNNVSYCRGVPIREKDPNLVFTILILFILE